MLVPGEGHNGHCAARLPITDIRNPVPLGLADSGHFRPASRADTLHRWSPILEDNLLEVLNLNLLPTLHAVCRGHSSPPLSTVDVWKVDRSPRVVNGIMGGTTSGGRSHSRS